MAHCEIDNVGPVRVPRQYFTQERDIVRHLQSFLVGPLPTKIYGIEGGAGGQSSLEHLLPS